MCPSTEQDLFKTARLVIALYSTSLHSFFVQWTWNKLSVGTKCVQSSNTATYPLPFCYACCWLYFVDRLYLRPMFDTQVVFAPMGYETLGLIFYEIIVPKGHNLEAWRPHIKVRLVWVSCKNRILPSAWWIQILTWWYNGLWSLEVVFD